MKEEEGNTQLMVIYDYLIDNNHNDLNGFNFLITAVFRQS